MQKTVCEINLPAIRRNAIRIRNILGGRKFYAVVKADAYGHGAAEVSRYIEDVADGFCTAIIDEGVALRIAGITKPVLVLTPPLGGDDVARASAYNLTLTVNGAGTAILARGAACQIKVNTGMNRYGCNSEELDGILKSIPAESIEGVYSHLYAPADVTAGKRQLEIFSAAAKKVKRINPRAVAHIAASGGLLRGEEFLADGARCGILLYGYAPDGFDRGDFEPAMKVYAGKVQTTKFIGGGAGYGRAERDYGTLTSYRCGYADGFFRTAPLGVNNLCMDAFVSEEDGNCLCVMSDADEYAKRCGTISYEILTSVCRRSERVYIR